MNTDQQLLTFSQQLIQTKSLPGEEEAVAKVVEWEMTGLNLDEVYIDEIGNVIGS